MSQEDFFQRSSFAVDLIKMVKDIPSPYSFGLDAEWGAGKTFFINNLLVTESHKQNIPCVIYDAFEHEKDNDVFLSLMANILEQVQLSTADSNNAAGLQEAIQDTIKSTSRVLRSVGRVVANAGSRIFLKHSLDEIQEAFDVDDEKFEYISDALEKEVVNFLEQRLEGGKSYKALKAEFQKNVRSLACALSNSGKILVVIDELDRCTPTHALKVLEATNHILNSEGLVFLFSYNRRQLENMVEHTYGSGINSAVYIQKFITFSFQFPVPHKSIYRSANAKLIQSKAALFNANGQQNNILQATLPYLDRINEHTPITPRLIHSLTSIAITVDELSYSYLDDVLSYFEMGVLLIFKLTNPNALTKLLSKYSTLQEVNDAMEELNYFKIFPQDAPEKQSFLTKFLLRRTDGSEQQTDEVYKRLNVINTLTNRN